MKILKAFFIIFLFSLSYLFIFFTFKITYLSNIEFLDSKIINGGIEIYDRTGSILLYKTGIKRSWVDFENIPQQLIQSFLVAEDENFYKHKGISLKGIIRSIYLNLKTKSLSYGGSTITQQLARNLFLTHKKTLWRKIQEILIALEIERKFSKDEILTYYLNSIYFGQQTVGIKAAAENYFNKKLKDLTWGEISILSSIPRSPNLYAPISEENLKNLKERRDYILKKLKEKNIISQKEYLDALNEKIEIAKTNYSQIFAPHFSLEVINQLKKMFSNEDIENLNLKIITTLDYKLQELAEKAVEDGAIKNKEKYNGANAALMAINPKTGEVLALVGSKNFFDESIDGQVNVPFRKRQPGSAFKPLVYATLFEQGYPDNTIIFDIQTNFGNYKPQNFDKVFKGPITLRQALAESRNVPSVKVFYLANPEKVIDLARKVGMDYLKNWENYGLSLSLGTAEVRMIDLIRFYGALANDGKLVSQTMILKIIQDNKVTYEYYPKEERIISSETARILNSILKDIEARKGLFSASLKYTIFPGYEVALKTGTTQFYQDAWTFGYTPNIVVGVWAGNTDGRRMNSLGASLVAALPIFHQFLSSVIENEKLLEENFIPPQERIVNKPMLNGQWITEYGIHNILFYVDKNNPLGPIPEDPTVDPQFYNWERGIILWLNGNKKI